MSATVFYPGGATEPIYKLLTGGPRTEVYESSIDRTAINGATIVNHSGSATDVVLEYYDGTTYTIFFKDNLADKETISIEYPQFTLRNGKAIYATGANNVTVWLTLSRTQSGEPVNRSL